MAVLVQGDRADNPCRLPAIRLAAESHISGSTQPPVRIAHTVASFYLDRGCLNVAVKYVFAFKLRKVAAPAWDLDVSHTLFRPHDRHRPRQSDTHVPAVHAVPDKITFAHIISSRNRSWPAAEPPPSRRQALQRQSRYS